MNNPQNFQFIIHYYRNQFLIELHNPTLYFTFVTTVYQLIFTTNYVIFVNKSHL